MNSQGIVDIALSAYAYRRIVDDMMEFGLCTKDPTKKKSGERSEKGCETVTGIINKIILNSYQTSSASMERLVAIEEEELRYVVFKGKHIDDEIITALLNRYRGKLVSGRTTAPKDKRLQLRLQNELFNLSEYDSSFKREYENSRFYGYRLSMYLKALLEDYSQQGLNERISIYFQDTIEEIQRHIDSKWGTLCEAEIGKYCDHEHRMRWLIKPYRIFSKPDMEPALLCLTSYDTYGEQYFFEAIPISYIRSFKVRSRSTFSGQVTDEEKERIESFIKEKYSYDASPHVLGTVEVTWRFLFSEDAYKWYNGHPQMRPPIFKTSNRRDGKTVVTFKCSSRQILNYFKPMIDGGIVSTNEICNYQECLSKEESVIKLLGV